MTPEELAIKKHKEATRMATIAGLSINNVNRLNLDENPEDWDEDEGSIWGGDSNDEEEAESEEEAEGEENENAEGGDIENDGKEGSEKENEVALRPAQDNDPPMPPSSSWKLRPLEEELSPRRLKDLSPSGGEAPLNIPRRPRRRDQPREGVTASTGVDKDSDRHFDNDRRLGGGTRRPADMRSGSLGEEELKNEVAALRDELRSAQEDITQMAKAKHAPHDSPSVRDKQAAAVAGYTFGTSAAASAAPRAAIGFANGGFEEGGAQAAVAGARALAPNVPGWQARAAHGGQVVVVRSGDPTWGGLAPATGNFFVAVQGAGSSLGQRVNPPAVAPGERCQLRFQAASSAAGGPDGGEPPALCILAGGSQLASVPVHSGVFAQHVVSFSPPPQGRNGEVVPLEITFEHGGGAGPAGWASTIFLDNLVLEVQPSKKDCIRQLFRRLDSDGNGRLDSAELRRYAELLGFDGSDEEWLQQYEGLASQYGFRPSTGAPEPCFAQLVNDEAGSGHCTVDELNEVLTSLNLDLRSPSVEDVRHKQSSTRVIEGSSSTDQQDLEPLDGIEADSVPELLLPLLAAKLKSPRNSRQFALRAKDVIKEGELPTAEQAITLVRWCWHWERPWLAGWVLLPLLVKAPESLTIRWVSLLVMFQLWRHATGGEGREYLVDNSELQAHSAGLGYRSSKDVEDIDGTKTAIWGTVVRGVDRGDGWLRVGALYLPMRLNGATVLVPLDGPLDEERLLRAEGPQPLQGKARPAVSSPRGLTPEELRLQKMQQELRDGQSRLEEAERERKALVDEVASRRQQELVSKNTMPSRSGTRQEASQMIRMLAKELQTELRRTNDQRRHIEEELSRAKEARRLRQRRAQEDLWQLQRNSARLSEPQESQAGVPAGLEEHVDPALMVDFQEVRDSRDRSRRVVAHLKQDLDMLMRNTAVPPPMASGTFSLWGTFGPSTDTFGQSTWPATPGAADLETPSPWSATGGADMLSASARARQLLRKVAAATPPSHTSRMQPWMSEVYSLAAQLESTGTQGAVSSTASPSRGSIHGTAGPMDFHGTFHFHASPPVSPTGSTAEGIVAGFGGLLAPPRSGGGDGGTLQERWRSVRLGEAELEEERQRLRTVAAEEADREIALKRGGELASRLMDFGRNERELAAQLAYLKEEIAALSDRYEQQKGKLFTFSSLLARPQAREGACTRHHADEHRHSCTTGAAFADPGPGRRGIEVLVKHLAMLCGSPEVAFIRLDITGKGKLVAEDLHLGLLLGAGVDYMRLTGASIHSLFHAFDRRRVGTINVKDVAETCPHLWRQHGGAGPSPAEKLRALPWSAVGGAEAAYEEAATDEGISWEEFEHLVTFKLQGLSNNEARALFDVLSVLTGGEAIPQDVWLRSTGVEAGSSWPSSPGKPRRP